MASLAEAMASIVQQIQATSQLRAAHLDQLQRTTKAFLQTCAEADRQRSAARRQEAQALQQQLKATQRNRLEATQRFRWETRQAIQSIVVRVSELRSDTHNLVQRFSLEHQDMARALRNTLAAATRARKDRARTTAREGQYRMNTLRQQMRSQAQHLQASLLNANNDRKQATRRAMHAVAEDVRQASRLWKDELKKKAPHSIVEVGAAVQEPIQEMPEAPAPVAELSPVISAPVVEEEAAERAAVEEGEPRRLASEVERVMQVIAAHPDGVRLVEIGNELGVDWRGLIGAVKFLLDEGKVEKIDNVYYPAQPGQEGE